MCGVVHCGIDCPVVAVDDRGVGATHAGGWRSAPEGFGAVDAVVDADRFGWLVCAVWRPCRWVTPHRQPWFSRVVRRRRPADAATCADRGAAAMSPCPPGFA